MIKLVVIGAINWDINIFVSGFAETGGEVPVLRVLDVPGGKGANVAVAATRILGADQVAIIGGLGQDQIAAKQINILEREGLDVSGIRRIRGARSGQAYIVVDSQGRKIIHTLFGANLRLRLKDLDTPQQSRLLKEAKVVAVIDPRKEIAVKVARRSKDFSKTVIFAPGTCCHEGLKKLSDVIRNSDYLVVNRLELSCLFGRKDLEYAIEALLRINSDLRLIVTLGADGATLLHGSIKEDLHGFDRGRFGLDVVNTTGCGDAFLGVFCASKIQRYSDMEAIRRGNLAGALKATKPETRGSPNAEEMKKYLDILSKSSQ